MVQKTRMGFGGLIVGASVVVMFLVTNALDIGGPSPGAQDENANAAPSSEASCAGLRDAAKGVMQARQADAAREAVAEVLAPLGEDGEMMLALAFGYPVHEAMEDKEQAIVEFTEGVHTKCLSVVAP